MRCTTARRLLLRTVGLAFSLLCGMAGCSASDSPRELIDGSIAAVDIQIYGTLRAMMHEGKVGPEVALDSLLPNGNLFGVGAISELRGEITIINGEVYLAYPLGTDSVRVEHSLTPVESAALLVTADVHVWTSNTFDASVEFDQLDKALAEMADRTGQDTSDIIPFLIHGRVEDLKWHVIDGRRLSEDDQTHESHQEAAVSQSASSALVTITGFYSSHHQGVFTHRDSRTHMHVVSDDLKVSGHVDRLRLPAGTTIQFPSVSSDSLFLSAMQFDGFLRREEYEAARLLMTSDPRRWFEIREGDGGRWEVGPGAGGPWKVWDDSMHSRRQELTWHRGDRSITVRIRETNDYFQLLERGWVTVDRSYFFDASGKIEGLVISKPFERPQGRTDEFLTWARLHDPDELAYLMPEGEINPQEDRAVRFRTLLIRWREDADLPVII